MVFCLRLSNMVLCPLFLTDSSALEINNWPGKWPGILNPFECTVVREVRSDPHKDLLNWLSRICIMTGFLGQKEPQSCVLCWGDLFLQWTKGYSTFGEERGTKSRYKMHMCGWKGETDTSALPSVCLRSKKQFQIDLLGVIHWIHFIAFLVQWWTSSLFERIWFYISEYCYLLDNSDCLLLLLSRDGVLLHM